MNKHKHRTPGSDDIFIVVLQTFDLLRSRYLYWQGLLRDLSTSYLYILIRELALFNWGLG